jgi:hypothetical protein
VVHGRLRSYLPQGVGAQQLEHVGRHTSQAQPAECPVLDDAVFVFVEERAPGDHEQGP